MECWCASTIKSWLLILMMILILMVCGIEGGCIQEERKALLQIKTSLIHSDFPSPLPSWVDDGGECCDWERVNCNTTTGHVIDLSLSNMMDGCERIWPLNSSLFLKFKELTSLNLSWNCLDDGIVNTGLGRLSSLKRLEILDLSFNSLTNGIFPSLNALTSLRVLDLGYNYLKGNFPALELAHLTNLEELDLSFNWLNGTPSIQGRLPDMKAQFSTFTKESYEGNPLLCGPPLEKNCTTTSEVIHPSAKEGTDKWYDIDITFFYGSFCATWVTFLLGFGALLYTNPYLRRRWLDLVEECMYACHHFLDLGSKLSMLFCK